MTEETVSTGQIDFEKLRQLLSIELGLKTKAARTFLDYALKSVQLFDKKQLDYGPENILAFGPFGVVVRMNDKLERMKRLSLPDLTRDERERFVRVVKNLKWLGSKQHRLSTIDVVLQLDSMMDDLKLAFKNRRRRAANESIKDSFRDLSVYALIALMLEEGKWGEE